MTHDATDRISKICIRNGRFWSLQKMKKKLVTSVKYLIMFSSSSVLRNSYKWHCRLHQKMSLAHLRDMAFGYNRYISHIDRSIHNHTTTIPFTSSFFVTQYSNHGFNIFPRLGTYGKKSEVTMNENIYVHLDRTL